MGTATIVITIVAIVVVAFLVYYFLIGEGEDQISLPIFSGATQTGTFGGASTPDNFLAEWSAREIPLGVGIVAYETTASFNNVMDWYRTKLPSEGWTIVYDNLGYFTYSALGNVLSGGIICETGDQMAGIGVVEYQGTTYFTLATAQKETFGKWILSGTEDGGVERVDTHIYAGWINENVVRFRFHYLGSEVAWSQPPEYELGPTMFDPTGKFRGSGGKTTFEENELYAWAFTNSNRFATGDWGECELLVHGADFSIGGQVQVKISYQNKVLYQGALSIDNFSLLPGESLANP